MVTNFDQPQLFTLNKDVNERMSDSKYYTVAEFNNAFSDIEESFSLLHINSRSLNKNFEYLENTLNTLNSFQFSVIGISETWLHSNSPPLFNLPNYHMVRADREGRRGGGVAFYVAEHLNFKVRHDIEFKDTEVLFIELENITGKNIIIGLIYRPPNTQLDLFYESFENCLDTLTTENKHVYSMGDYNINFLPSNSNNTDKFINLMYSYDFYSYISKPTRINIHSSTLIL